MSTPPPSLTAQSKLPQSKERRAELRAEQNAKSEMSRDEYRRFLVDIIRAKPKDTAFNNPLCELVFARDGRQVVDAIDLGMVVNRGHRIAPHFWIRPPYRE